MRILRSIENGFAWITYIALFAMMVLITVDAIGRYVLRVTLPDVFHLTELFLMPLVICFAMAQTQRTRNHVNVTLLSQFFPERLTSGLLAAVFLTAGVICAAITVSSWEAAWPHLKHWRVTGGLIPWPTGVSRVIIPIGFGLLSVRLLVDTVVEIRRTLDPASVPPAGEDGAAPPSEQP